MEKEISIKNYQLNDNFKDYIDCPICYNLTDDFFKANCNHSWCNKCNLKINSNLCPLCRKQFKITKKNIKDISNRELELLRLRREIRREIRNRNNNRNNNIIIDFIDKSCCIN